MSKQHSGSIVFANVFVATALTLSPGAAASPSRLVSEAQTPLAAEAPTGFGDLSAFRVQLELRSANDYTRASKVVGRWLGALPNKQTRYPIQMKALVTGAEQEQLTRIGIRPVLADELNALIEGHAKDAGDTVNALRPILARLNGTVAERLATTITTADAEVQLRATLAALSLPEANGMNLLTSLDDDGDGLTNTQETWWCTDPLNANSDGDANGWTDGQEVAALLNVTLPRTVRWAYGPPFGPPNVWPDFNGGDGNQATPACNDGDNDTIPDYAEIWMVGTRVPEESSDLDKFDDGQEIFGITYCPGAPTNCGYGSLPAGEYWNYIKASMPNWVLPPGDSPFVTAFPQPEISVQPGSWRVDRVTTVTTQQGTMSQASKTFGSESRRGQNTGVADQRSWNGWEELSTSIDRPMGAAARPYSEPYAPSALTKKSTTFKSVQKQGLGVSVGDVVGADLSSGQGIGQAVGAVGAGVLCAATGVGVVFVPLCSLAGGIIGSAIGGLFDEDKDETQSQGQYDEQTPGVEEVPEVDVDFDSEGLAKSMDGIQYAINKQGQVMALGLHNMSISIDRQTAVLESGFDSVTAALLTPRQTETRLSGRSSGGSQTYTSEEYEEHALTEQNSFATGENWSTAWAADSSHAANLSFTYTVRNVGTEYARELSGLVFNVYVGDGLIASYPAWQSFPNGTIANLFPSDPPVERSSTAIPLTLDQMRQIDEGAHLRIVVADYDFGSDELYYQNARTGGITVQIEDGVEDNDETIDTYVIPTWEPESFQDVLARYFPTDFDSEGRMNGLWTPEYNGVQPPSFREHAISDMAWWKVFLTQSDAGSVPLRDLRADPGSGILIRMNRDSDRDGYQDRVEMRYGTDRNDPASHPMPEVLAGYVSTRTGNLVTVTIALENNGTFDAYGIQVTMYSPDDTTTVVDNIVGGNGRVRPGQHVAVGSYIKAPVMGNWTGSTAKPYAAGDYSGPDRTFTFTVSAPGTIGSGSTAVTWAAAGGISGTLSLGASYHAPLPENVKDGLQVGFNTGVLAAGNWFTVTALTPRDTLRYIINTDPNNSASYTEPLIVVSTNDPQGNRKFVTPLKLSNLAQDLAPFSAQMMSPLEFSIRTHHSVTKTAPNTTTFVFNSPHLLPISGARLYLDFVADGVRVLNISRTLDIQPGPNLLDVAWSTSQFTQTYDPDKDNILIAHWTDSEKNIIDSSARPLALFVPELGPRIAMGSGDPNWRLGTVVAGERLATSIAVANSDVFDLKLGTPSVDGAGLSAALNGSGVVPALKYREISLTLDTTGLPTGPYSGSVKFRTNDIGHRLQSIQVSGTITAPVGGPIALATNMAQPWQESVVIPTGVAPSSVLSYPASSGPTPLTPLFLQNAEGARLGNGLAAINVPTQTAAAPSRPSATDDSKRPSAPNDAVAFTVIPDGDGYYKTTSPNYTWVRIASQGWPLNSICSPDPNKPYWVRSHPNNDHNWVDYLPNLPIPAWYRVEAWFTETPTTAKNTSQLDITIYHMDGASGRVMDTENHCYWNDLGTYRFGAGRSGNAKVNWDNKVGDAPTSSPWKLVVSDQVRWILLPPETPGMYGIGNSDYDENYVVDWTDAFGMSNGYLLQEWNGSSWYDVYYGTNSYWSAGGHGYGDFCYRVFADNAGGRSGASGTQCVSVRPVPAAPTLSAISNADADGTYNVAWGGVAWGSTYRLQERLGAGAWNDVQNSGATNWTATGRASGTWCYHVAAINPRAQGAWSGEQCALVNAAPNTPYGLSPASGSARLGRAPTLTWIDAGDPDNPLPGRQFDVTIQRVDGSWSMAVTHLLTTTWKPSLPADGSYKWKVRAFDGILNSDWSAESTLAIYSVERADAATVRFALPTTTTGLTRFGVAYGVPITLSSPAVTGTATIQIPRRNYKSAKIDIVVPISLSLASAVELDVGLPGQDWSTGLVSGPPRILPAIEIATALNAFLAQSTAAPGAMVNVPVSLTASLSGVLYLANLNLTPYNEGDPWLPTGSLNSNDPSPTEGDAITVTALLANGWYTSSNVLVAFFAGDPQNGGRYLGSDFVPVLPYSTTRPAAVRFDTTGYSGPISVTALINPSRQISELNYANNTMSTTVQIRTRADLRVRSTSLPEADLTVGKPATFNVVVGNEGQTAAPANTLGLFHGNADAGIPPEEMLDLTGVSAGGAMTLNLTYTPTMPGPLRLSLRANLSRTVNEFDLSNNDLWLDRYVGVGGERVLDSGNPPNDPTYTVTLGYGAVDEGQPDATAQQCPGSPGGAEDTFRRDPGGRIVARFDHLKREAFYHLDVVLNGCNAGAGRQEVIKVNGVAVAGPIDIGGANKQRISRLLDPALYADRAISVTIETTSSLGAVASVIAVREVEYRYIDAGGGADPAYSPQIGQGWVDTPTAVNGNCGPLPYQTLRVDQNDNELRYRFDGLNPTKKYTLRTTFYQCEGINLQQGIQIDGRLTGVDVFILPSTVVVDEREVPLTTYANDGSIDVSILRQTDATGALVSEIAIEEKTLEEPQACPPLRSTTADNFSMVYGGVFVGGLEVPQGTLVTAEDPRGNVIGCFAVSTAGIYGTMALLGEDTSVSPALAGLRAGEPPLFRIGGALAVPQPAYSFTADADVHPVTLTTDGIGAQQVLMKPGWNFVSTRNQHPVGLVETVLRPISGKYCRVRGETQLYACNIADPFRTLKRINAGPGYYIYITNTATVNGLFEGVTLAPSTPISMHAGLNWTGYLPPVSLPITYALQSIAGHYLRVVDVGADPVTVYMPTLPQFSFLTTLHPGRAYLIYMLDAMPLTYPDSALAPDTPVDPKEGERYAEHVLKSCGPATKTPDFTLLYGQARLNGRPADPGAKIEVLGANGAVVACTLARENGQFGFAAVFGADPLNGIAGPQSQEALRFRINGVMDESSAWTWVSDHDTHWLDLSANGHQLFLPAINR